MMCNTPEQNGAQFAKELATLQWREQKKTSFLRLILIDDAVCSGVEVE